MVQKARTTEILQAAARVFRKKGFHAARIQDVADELGMQKGSLYHYISTKQDLLKGLVEGAMQRLIAALHGICDTGHPAGQKLAMAIEAHLRLTQEDRDIWGILQREDLDLLNRGSQSDLRAVIKEYESTWDRLVTAGVESGEFDPSLDGRVVVQAILGMCNATGVWFRPDGRLPIQEVARIFSEIVLRGVRPPRHLGATGERR
jgi:AcrR family transcriptional regulator